MCVTYWRWKYEDKQVDRTDGFCPAGGRVGRCQPAVFSVWSDNGLIGQFPDNLIKRISLGGFGNETALFERDPDSPAGLCE